VIAVTVQPDLPAARVPYGDARLGVLVARREFPANPCNGHEQVQLTARPPAWTRGVEQVNLYGAADLAGQRCLIWVRSHLDRATTCKLVAHEENHWNGASDNDGTALMAEGGAVVYDGDRPGHALGWPYAPCEVPR
jgi:hypothetical protein